MKKMKKSLLLLLLVATTFSFGQSANLDRAYFKVRYTRLPATPILDASKRTYSTNNSQLYVAGFSQTDDATLTIHYQFDETNAQFIKIDKREDIKKDKEGKVISRKMYYSAISQYTSSGSFSVKNAITGKTHRHPFFYKDEDKSSEFDTYSKAVEDYRRNKYDLKNQYEKKHRDAMIRESNDYLNTNYGYPINKFKGVFWILGKKKHPEYAKHRANYEKAKEIFSKMKADEPIDDIKKELQPVIDYFIATAKKYVGKKKRMRKMRYASYYNLAAIYYYLDNPAKTKEYAEKLIANDYDKKDGKHFIRIADKLQARFNVNKTTSRHFKVNP